ncbi:MAG: CBS domain-containing protein [Alphaproteobacteria bacterium]
MKVESILKTKGTRVVTTRPHTTVMTLVNMMKLERVGSAVVSDDGVRVLGIVSERDIVNGLTSYGADLLQRRVEEIMTRDVLTCSRDDSVKAIMALMTRRRVRHIPVVENGELRGLISIGDVVKNRLEEIELETGVLRDYAASR